MNLSRDILKQQKNRMMETKREMGSLDILQGLFFQWYVSRAQCTISRENFLNILLLLFLIFLSCNS